jgi:hypothetical protein
VREADEQLTHGCGDGVAGVLRLIRVGDEHGAPGQRTHEEPSESLGILSPNGPGGVS